MNLNSRVSILLFPILFLFLVGCALQDTSDDMVSDTNFSEEEKRTLRQSDEPPTVPIGLDAYRMWPRLPYQRIGVRGYMKSTFDRRGANRKADASNFLYQEADDFNVTMDVKGPGVFYFKRTNHFHGSPWHYEVDGKDMVVKETATSDPVNAKEKFDETHFIPEKLFPSPLVWTWGTTKGADLNWTPMPFEKSFRIAYSRTHYGTGYYILHRLTPGMQHLSQPLTSWDRSPPDPEVLRLLEQSGTDIAPKGKGVTTYSGTIDRHGPEETTVVTRIQKAPATIRALKIRIPREQATDFGNRRLRITWDRREHPSVKAPVDLFFGAGKLTNPDDRKWLVKGFPMGIRYDNESVLLYCYYPMPFFREARIELTGGDANNVVEDIQWEIRTEPLEVPINHVSYFHATYTDHPNPEPGKSNVFLDTSKVEGGGPWSGQFVGMSWIFTRTGTLNTLEGDPRFYFDGSKSPQAHGTGTEEWGGGGDYWGGENMTIPLAGHPVGKSKKDGNTNSDKSAEAFRGRTLTNSAYRFLIADHFPFGNRARITLEHGAFNRSDEHYSAVTYWYGIDSPTLIQTDTVDVCEEESRISHNYRSTKENDPYKLRSKFQQGVDAPWTTDEVRTMNGTSTFTVSLNPNNLGVMLRRKFDYKYPNQNARVWVRAKENSEWKEVGRWYTAGSSTLVYSYPKGDHFTEAELGETQHQVTKSDRRWKESEFLIPRKYTEDTDQLEVKIKHEPVERELYPGHPYPAKPLWSAAHYEVFCYRMPKFDLSSHSGR